MVTKRHLKGLGEYQSVRRQHWNEVAISLEDWRGWGGYYHRRLTRLMRLHIPPGRSVMEIGCGDGNLLA
ncbi:MAG: hypothetical protein P8Y37_08475, partial [Anaerolineales bacterium]